MPKVIDLENVYKATIDILVTHGYENATTKKIAEAAGMHEATLFRKFGSKISLVEKAIEVRLSDTPFSRLTFSGNIVADLLSILQAYQQISQEHGEIMPMILFEVGRNPELENLFKKPWENIQLVLIIIEKYQRLGMLKEEPMLLTLNVFLAPIMIRNMFEKANTKLPVPTIDSNQYISSFLHGRHN